MENGMKKIVVVLATVLLLAQYAIAKDWPQWHGPNRDNISTETGLMKQWPEEGPQMLWSIEGMGTGYSTVSIADGFIYVTGMIKKEGVLSKIDLAGKLIWQKPYAQEWYKSFPGTRSTATINDGCAYIMGGNGDVVCMDIKTGEKKWSVNTFTKYGGKLTYWGVAESLVVDSEKVYCMAGGTDASIVALDKDSGEEVWTTKGLSDGISFSSPILVEHHGKKQLISVLASSVVGVDIQDGKVLWNCPNASFHNPGGKADGIFATACTPIYKDGCVFVTTPRDNGAGKISISADNTTATVVWKNHEFDTQHGGIVLVDGMLYGANWISNAKGDWQCVDFETGKTMYTHSWDGNKGSVLYADKMLYCYAEKTGIMALVKPDPSEFAIVSSFEVTLGKKEHWAHPVISDGRLYVRHGDILMAYDIKADE
jgi:outer membrane protein assembly factor BamB